MPRSIVAIAILAAGALTAHAIISKRCAKKCTFQTGSCVVERGVAQCGNAEPARPCLDQLDAHDAALLHLLPGPRHDDPCAVVGSNLCPLAGSTCQTDFASCRASHQCQ